MIDSKKLLSDLQKQVRVLEGDLRDRCEAEPGVDAPLREQYEAAKKKKRTAQSYKVWRDEELIQVAVAWVLAGVFVRFLEDNGLVETPKLAGPGDRLRRARDEHELFFQRHPTSTEREFLLEAFEETGRLPGMREFFDKKHNPLWLAAPTGDACRELWQFWQKTNAETGNLIHNFTDSDWNTRFLGDLYQDLSEAARKRFALLQTPDFVEEFILDRTLTPAIDTFGFREVRMIDPTCGSGHFLLGGFARLFRIWQEECPGENPRALAQKALDGAYGVDLNPFAVAIARFRLLLAALRVCSVKRLKDAPDFKINLAVGDSLLHGRRFREFDANVGPQTSFNTGNEHFEDELAHFFDTEDSAELHRILGQQYHAVVGNPPYITVKDKALNQLYRDRYESCSGKYALSVPFMERFFDLAVTGSGDGRELAGFTGQITSNSFMKRPYARTLIEQIIPKWDLTTIVDSAGASIPGHNRDGTPTVILFGRNRDPAAPLVRAVLGIRSEPAAPSSQTGEVWKAIINQIDMPGTLTEWIVSNDVDRSTFHKFPWVFGGGGNGELKDAMDANRQTTLGKRADTLRGRPNIGITAFTLEDDMYLQPKETLERLRISNDNCIPIVDGDNVRDWYAGNSDELMFPYDAEFNAIQFNQALPVFRSLWNAREVLANSKMFGKKTKVESGLKWFEFGRLTVHKLRRRIFLTFSDLATHNHFVVNCERRVFNRHAPLVILPKSAKKEDYLKVAGITNSSSACFWLKQVCFPKDGSAKEWHERFEFAATLIASFPLPAGSPLTLARELDRLARELSSHSPDALAARDAVSAAGLSEAAQTAADLRARMISLQEELDWQCYRHYGLIDADDDLEWPEDLLDTLPPITLGERAFEIRMARRMKDEGRRMNDEGVSGFQTTWFERHKHAGSKPITELPAHWPDDYRALVERRLAFIEANKNINLIERPEYKRRWNTEPWAKRQEAALRKWLLARLEGYFFEGSRVCDLQGTFDPAAHGFTAATGPHLVSANQLADVVAGDAQFLEAAEVYLGGSGFSVPKLVRELVEAESVPYLPFQRYKDSGLRKRQEWETTWALQRQEDAVEARVRQAHPELTEVELKAEIREAQQREVGEIAVPPKYAAKDFKKGSYWKLRGKLDVPKERWVSYPGAERAGDDSLVIAWAGWDHLQQAQALAEYFIDAQSNQGWPSERLRPLLAGLSDLIPWLKQWHNAPDPDLGMGLGDYFTGFLEEQCRDLGMTVGEAEAARFSESSSS